MKNIMNPATGEFTTYTDGEFIIERDKRLQAWEASKQALEIAKQNEMTARKDAVNFCFDQDKDSGTERIDLGNNWQAKAVKKINYGFIKNADGKVDKNRIEAALLRIEQIGGQTGELIAERLIKWTPDLSLTEYNKLEEVNPLFKSIIDEVIVTTEGAPTLEIIPPKGAK